MEDVLACFRKITNGKECSVPASIPTHCHCVLIVAILHSAVAAFPIYASNNCDEGVAGELGYRAAQAPQSPGPYRTTLLKCLHV